MTKKHFEAIAAVFSYRLSMKESRDVKTATCDIAACLADVFERENPRFDRVRFLKACGVTE